MTRLGSRTAIVGATLTVVCLHYGATESPRAQSAPRYTLIDLGTLGGASAQAADVNDAGQVVGYSSSSVSGSRAFRWESGAMSDLGTLGGNSSWANAVNGFGHVAGVSSMPVGSGRAALWRNGTIVNLTPDLPNTVASTAAGVNDFDQVLIQFGGNVFVWQNGSRVPVNGLGGGATYPADINNAGQAVGSSYHPDMTPLGLMQHAFLWENGVTFDLGLLPGDEDSGASAINSHGVIVGSSGRTDPDTYESTYRPFIYQHGAMAPIPAPSSEAYGGDINDFGVVVGTMRAGNAVTPWHAWIYENGVVTNLNSLKPSGTGLHLAYATAINNAGQIVGVAYDAQARYHAFLLTPCEPSCGPPPVVPAVNINDVTKAEGNNGTTSFPFTISLSAPTTAVVRVNFMTANIIAVAGVDYTFANGTLVFNPGETSKTVTVAVRGDRTREQDETFRVNLSGADGATLFDSSGLAIIRNDDR
jgi:probable HAF family extracellular repeat protein